ncbi:MAG: DUF418 domain-containing protein [Actinomycetota bacterium]|nr:DUF418 domain-containing protein [Actinomycetota bacterium]
MTDADGTASAQSASLSPDQVSPASSATALTPRIVDLDVIRAVALIGVCVMNYHGYLIHRGAKATPTNVVERFFDPWTGPLSTRFAATFVTVAGMGITLLTRRSTASRDRAAISADRWKLARRGVLLFAFGYFLDWVWPGTILFYYGAFFVAGAVLFTLRSRWLALIGAAAAAAAAGLQWWVLQRTTEGRPPYWLVYGNATTTQSPRDLLLDTFVRGTHPLLPWLVFLCMGMVLGRLLPFTPQLRQRLAGIGMICLALGYLLRHVLTIHPMLRSTAPFDRGALYTLTTVGSTLMAVCLIGWITQRTAGSELTQGLAATGRTTLSLYMAHVLVFNLLVDWLEWVHPGTLTTALVFAGVFWMFAVLAATAWQLWRGIGPLEWVYRRFSDAGAGAGAVAGANTSTRRGG